MEYLYGLRITFEEPIYNVETANGAISGLLEVFKFKYVCKWIWLIPELHGDPSRLNYRGTHYHGFMMIHDQRGFTQFLKKLPKWVSFHFFKCQNEIQYLKYCLKEYSETEASHKSYIKYVVKKESE